MPTTFLPRRGLAHRIAPETAGRVVPPARLGLTLVGAGVLAVVVVAAPGSDAHSYWSFSADAPYAGAVANLEGFDAFRYAPPMGLAFLPLHVLTWSAFRLAWLAAAVAALRYVAGGWTLAAIALFPVALELWWGNVYLLMAAAILAGFRYPAAWSFLLLTKVTPGIGLLWFAVRREWRSLGIAVAATLALAAFSAVLVPSWWPQWIDMLRSNAGMTAVGPLTNLGVPLAVRLPAAALVVTWGARTDRAWTVPVAVVLAMPTIFLATFAVLVAVPRAGACSERRGEPVLSVANVTVTPESADRTLLTAANTCRSVPLAWTESGVAYGT